MNSEIVVEKKESYGRVLYYPTEFKWQKYLRNVHSAKTFSKNLIVNLKELGFTFTVNQETKSL